MNLYSHTQKFGNAVMTAKPFVVVKHKPNGVKFSITYSSKKMPDIDKYMY